MNYFSIAKTFFVKKSPIDVTFFVTNKCNARCRHCFYHESLNRREEELSLPEIRRIFHGLRPLARVLLSGGEPFLHKDIDEIVKIIHKAGDVHRIKIPTNGTVSDKILSDVRSILKECPHLTLDIGVSLDGLDEDRDHVMGIEGSFRRSMNTYTRLQCLKKEHPNLIVGVIITQMHSNQERISEIYSYACHTLKADSISFCGVRGSSFKPEEMDIDIGIYENIVKKIKIDTQNKGTLLNRIYEYQRNKAYDYVLETRRRGKRVIPCYSGQIKLVITPKGDVYPCEEFMLTEKTAFQYGNLRDYNYDIKSMMRCEKARKIIKHIMDQKCWCCNECDMSVSVFFNLGLLLKRLQPSGSSQRSFFPFINAVPMERKGHATKSPLS